MRHIRKTACLGAIATAFATMAPASGEGMFDGEWSGNVALTSDYKFRGITQTDNAPMVSGGFDWASDELYVGTWASGVDFGDGTSTEIDIYGGWTPSLGMFDLDLGAIYYIYPDAPDEPEQNFVEIYGGASTTLAETFEVGASVAYSPDFYFEAGQSTYTSFSVGVPVGSKMAPDGGDFISNLGIDGAVGFQAFHDEEELLPGGAADNYTDYSVGLSTAFGGFGFDLRYIDTTGLDGNDDDESVVFTISRSL